MARIQPLSPESAPAACRDLFQSFLRERGAVPNLFLTLARSPEILKTAFAHFRAVMAEGTVSTRLKEMLFVRVSHLNRCGY